MRRFDEDLIAERLSKRNHRAAASTVGVDLQLRAAAEEYGFWGPAEIY